MKKPATHSRLVTILMRILCTLANGGHPGHAAEQRRAYAAMITALDDQVGRIVAALEKKKLRDKTLIVFSSDNNGALSGLFASGSKSKTERESEVGGIAQSAVNLIFLFW